MEVQPKKLTGSWDLGYALHKHTLTSTYVGDDEWGHAKFDTTRSEPGECLYQLKYRGDWSKVQPLALEIQANLLPLFEPIHFIVPMPASTRRARQPVNEVARALGELTRIPVFENMLVKVEPPLGSPTLKNLHGREAKDAALEGRISLNQCITNEGLWNVLLLDDLFDTGATMDAACRALRTYGKVNRIFAATITWK